MEVLLDGLLVVIMFNLLRWFERWLHQHIFKVGWLLTKNFQTTTILYYTFFLPGVFLYELAYWLAAGALNVYADRTIAWPEKQEIGELRLNFVKLSPKASPVKVAIISIAPLIVGLASIAFIAYNILDASTALIIMRGGDLHSVMVGVRHILDAPDFWLWAYILFAISNTMMPNPNALRGWRWIAGGIGIVVVGLFLLGVGNEVIGTALIGPVARGLQALSGIFGIVILANIVAVAILGTIEAIIERVTGHSATFKNGKMIVLRREEAIIQRKQALQKARAAHHKQQAASSAAQGKPSIYKLALPIPGPPGKEPVTQSPNQIVTSGKQDPPAPKAVRPPRQAPDVIPGKTTQSDSSGDS